MATKKNKKRKIKYKMLFMVIILFIVILSALIYISEKPLSNIYITGNKILTDKDIINIAKLENYPPYINTYFINIKDNLLKNSYIKDVKIERKLPSKIYLNVTEHKPICIYNNDLILSSKEKVANDYNIDYVPYVINNMDNVYDKFVEKFSLVDDSILLKISHIEYKPNEVDKERFLLYMVDANYVYITLSKIEKINKYNSIVFELDGKKGIVNLDSGDYVEIKSWQN